MNAEQLKEEVLSFLQAMRDKHHAEMVMLVGEVIEDEMSMVLHCFVLTSAPVLTGMLFRQASGMLLRREWSGPVPPERMN